MITYTYPVDGSEPPVSGMDAWEVADARLLHDGHDYRLVPRDGGWLLVVSRGSRNSPQGAGEFVPAWSGSQLLWSPQRWKASAWEELVERVIYADWPRVPSAMTDDDYRKMVDDFADEEE